VGFENDFERERARYEDGEARLGSEQLDPGQLVRLGNAAYGAGLALLMLGDSDEASAWLDRAAFRWRESWEHASPTSWGRPVGVIKAALLAGASAAGESEWALELGTRDAESPIGRYAAVLALLALGRWQDAAGLAPTLQEREDFPPAVADALAAVAQGASTAADEALERVLESFESREDYLEDVAVADTVLVLQVLGRRRGLEAKTRASALLPA
jgi:hypothetical protein